MSEIIDRLLATLHRGGTEPLPFDQAVVVMGRNHVARHKILTALGGSKTYAPEIAVLSNGAAQSHRWPGASFCAAAPNGCWPATTTIW